MIVPRILASGAGSVLVLWTLGSAIQTVVVPRAVATILTRAHFLFIRRIFDQFASTRRPFASRDRVMSLYSPVALVALPGVWVTLLVAGFTAIFWGTGIDPLAEAFATSGSSLLTLGFDHPAGSWRILLSFVEAVLGLGIVSLMISYLPTIYGNFSRREQLVSMLAVRAGEPPTPTQLFERYGRLGWSAQIDSELCPQWEQWFIDVEESHTTQPSLIFFRSPQPTRSWLTAAGCMLDAGALMTSTLERPTDARPALMLRTGFLCLRRIADFYGIPYEANPDPTSPISISRDDFDEVCDELLAADVALKPDRDQAWADFAGWRVNYDEVLLQLCVLAMAPPGRWSSDRSPLRRYRPRILRGRAKRL